jgi:hypothetical protein
MSEYRFVFIQAASGSNAGNATATQVRQGQTQAPQPPANADAATRQQWRDQLRELAQDVKQFQAQQGAHAAAEAAARTRVITVDGRPIVIDEGRVRGEPVVTVHSGQENLIPPQVVDMTIAFFIMLAVIIIGLPLARALGRRLDRRGEPAALPDPAIAGQLQRIEQAVEAMSIEIERISESQRFIAKLQNGAAERAPLGTGERR